MAFAGIMAITGTTDSIVAAEAVITAAGVADIGAAGVSWLGLHDDAPGAYAQAVWRNVSPVSERINSVRAA